MQQGGPFVRGQANPLNDLAVDVLIMSLKDDLPSLVIPVSQISNLPAWLSMTEWSMECRARLAV